MSPLRGWAGPHEELGRYIAEQSQSTLDAYREQPKLVTEHANLEQDTAQGGYQRRQLFELVQNSADALAPVAATGDRRRPGEGGSGEAEGNGPDTGRVGWGAASASARTGRIEIRLVADRLYCADDGNPIDEDGVTALMFSHMSPKRATSQIGTFGVGFKSLLGVCDAPEFLSRAGSFRFDRNRSRERIRRTVGDAPSYPVLRVADPIDPAECLDDDVGRELMGWASNIVRLPLKPGAYEDLHEQMREFPAEFLLFVNHVQMLRLTGDSPALNRVLGLIHNDVWRLHADGTESSWKLFDRRLRLSPDAAADRRHGESQDGVRLWWAAPLERLDQPGKFWAFFPTETASLAAGILNAPWKTNVDRQNLLPGPYNDDLIRAAAEMIAEALPELATSADPARHLDALPRRHEAGDNRQADLLRDHLFSTIHRHAILPDQDGRLRQSDEIRYAPSLPTPAPRQSTEALALWAAHETRPTDWLHHTALTRTRMARVNTLFESDPASSSAAAPRASVGEWLEALVSASRNRDPVRASKAVVRIAALLDRRSLKPEDLGPILLTASGAWRRPDPESIFLPRGSATDDATIDPRSSVHPALVSDRAALSALRELGIKEPTPEIRFRLLAKRVLQDIGALVRDGQHREFWLASRRVNPDAAFNVIMELTTPRRDGRSDGVRVLTRSGAWAAPHSVLLPGPIVPGDGSRDDGATVDMDFHGPDAALLSRLGVVKQPRCGRDLQLEPSYGRHEDDCELHYRSRDDLPYTPRHGYLSFTSNRGLGPLDVLTTLSHEGRALYTDALLSDDECYAPLTMWHTGSNREWYPEQDFESLAVRMIRNHGRIRTADGIVKFADALGSPPRNADALLRLLRHPKAASIQEAFDLADPEPEFFGEHDPVPLIDVWPGLQDYMHGHIEALQLVHCERIRVGVEDRACLLDGDHVYLAADSDEDGLGGLRPVLRALELNLSRTAVEDIAAGTTRAEVEERRARVRQHTTDAGRLLAAVGENSLRAELPPSLLAALDHDSRGNLSGTDIAEATIATYHTDALRQLRHRLGPLKPPSKWAGSARAIDFVRSLGFTEEWAGERSAPHPPFEVVDGPWELPDLHDYQRTVVQNVRGLLRAEAPADRGRRGMISMPTGSGKTRVAVQAIVEAIRDDGLGGGVLWIADRGELCEQAVEAWRQVWASIGSRTTQLRISRMWSGQPRPLPVHELHVVVATIQTAHSKLSSSGYDFLKKFRLVVFDEAHRSIAPTSTTVFGELGLTFRTRHDEPFLLGLTATPYRGHDEAETTRLVNRYGSNRLDKGAFDDDDPQAVIEELQRTEVLARADHELIDGGTFKLSVEELNTMRRFARGRTDPVRSLLRAWLPPSAEERIARDAERTRRIVDAYAAHIEPGWPTLVFATSVEHAKTVSALLNRKGITARAVSAETDHATRRRVVEQFRSGEINALVNYAVFREGFDAPRTRAIIVARPVYSPNLYFQMVGRGVRGPKNGGSRRCLILNVRDNIENFDRALAFSDLDWLWAR